MIDPIQISPSDLILAKAGKKGDKLDFLKKYQTVEARVTRVMSHSKAEVVIAGNRVIINTPFALKEGQMLSLNLIRDGSYKVFSLLSGLRNSEAKQNITALLKTAGQSSPFSAISSLNNTEGAELLKSFSLQSEKADHGILGRILDKSGMLFEKKAAALLEQPGTFNRDQAGQTLVKNDLKAMALEFLGASGQKDSTEAKAKALTDFSSAMEKFQLINTKTGDSGRYLIPFPVFADDGFSFGNLFLDLGYDESGKEKDKDRVVKVSLLLNMTALGPLRADFSIFKKALSGSFALATREIRDFVKKGLPILIERLEQQEYTIQKIECRTAEPVELTSADLVDKVIADSDGAVNIVI